MRGSEADGQPPNFGAQGVRTDTTSLSIALHGPGLVIAESGLLSTGNSGISTLTDAGSALMRPTSVEQSQPALDVSSLVSRDAA